MDPAGGAEEASTSAEDLGEMEMPQLEVLDQLDCPAEADEQDDEGLEAADLEAAEPIHDESGDAAEVTEDDDAGVEETDENIADEEEEGEQATQEDQDEEMGEDETEGIEECEDEQEGNTVADLETEVHEEEQEEEGEEEEEAVDKPLEDEDDEVGNETEEDDDAETDKGAGGPGATETNNNNNNKEKENPEQAEGVAGLTRKRTASHASNDEGPKRKQGRSASAGGSKHDEYCWSCHKDGVQAFCKICPRSYHFKCMHLPDEPPVKGQAESTAKSCICPECAVVMNAENLETRSEAMKQLTVDQLITMLKNACQRMKNTPQAEPFLYPVDQDEAVDYFTYVVYPMDLTTLEKNVKQRQYGSTEAFLADAQWMVHNSIVFNSASSPFTAAAKRILKTCKQEIQEIETCPECYVNAHHKPESWFIEACKRPHIVVWAKLKGFPFWPAKAMKIKDDMVDVRFFGQHDRAWVCMKDCFLYSEEMPGSAPKRNNQLLAAIDELNAHIQKLKDLNGSFVFAPPKTPIGPELSLEQIRKMLPEYKPDGPSPTQKTITQVAKTELTPQPKGKSPMTIRISLLKSNPTIVNSSVTEEPSINKPMLRIRKPKPPASSNADNLSEDPQRKAEGESTESMNNTKSEVTDEEASAPDKGSEILANALGLSRMTRRSSRSENASPASMGDQSIPNGGKRSTRSVLKDPRSSESGQSGEESKEEIAPPPDAFLQSIGLRKTSDVKSINSSSAPVAVKSRPGIVIKGEPEDPPDEEMEDLSDDMIERSGGVGVKAQELMNQISGNKPGLRFNLSKDISISPVGDEMGSGGNVRPRRPMMPGSNRMPPGLIPQSIHMQMGARHRLMGNGNGGMGNQTQRLLGQRPLTRPMRPSGGQLRPGMKMNRPPPNQMHMRPQGNQKPKDSNSPIVVESSSLRIDGQPSYTTSTTAGVQMNQSMQGGAITLPGGTITVTPLTPIIGVTTYGSSSDGNVNGAVNKTNQSNLGLIQHNIATTSVTAANGLPISVISPHDSTQSQQHKSKVSGPQRRNLMNQIPPSVGHMVQSLQKNLLDMVKTTMENIVIEIVDNAPGLSGGAEMKAIKQENEKLQKQIIDFKHNQDIALREVKMGMESDKKRTVNELRRQFEHEKLKAVEETKKKQWCARCSREAQFYCCWNTSYCGYGCQEDHWPAHMSSCSQASGGGGGGGPR